MSKLKSFIIYISICIFSLLICFGVVKYFKTKKITRKEKLDKNSPAIINTYYDSKQKELEINDITLCEITRKKYEKEQSIFSLLVRENDLKNVYNNALKNYDNVFEKKANANIVYNESYFDNMFFAKNYRKCKVALLNDAKESDITVEVDRDEQMIYGNNLVFRLYISKGLDVNNNEIANIIMLELEAYDESLYYTGTLKR